MIPQLQDWHERYAASGLTVIGIHSPEFFWERSGESLKEAVQQLGIGYAVVQDNDHAIWKRYAVRGWPTTILVDRQGVLRYRHLGEGGYEEAEKIIRRLLTEQG